MRHDKANNAKRKLLQTAPVTAAYQPVTNQFFVQQPRELPLFSFDMIRAMLWDPTIRLGLAMRAAPICAAEFAWKDGETWVPGVKADKLEVGEFVHQQLQRLWKNDLHRLLKAQIWGWAAGEVMYKYDAKNRRVEYDRIETRHAMDVRAMTHKGQLAGVKFMRLGGAGEGAVTLRTGGIQPKAFWHSHNADCGSHYGWSVLMGAYSPWADKWFEGMALDVRRLYMHKDAYGGMSIYYPPGFMQIEGLGNVPCRDIAREIVEQAKAGNVIALPSMLDANGNQLWKVERATAGPNAQHILDYPKELDVEMLRGIEVPDDVLTSENGGAWQGKQVPQLAFFTGLNIEGNSIVGDVVKQIMEPLVLLNWGRAEEFEACLKPLAIQASEASGAKPESNGGGPQPNPFAPQQAYRDGQYRMSLNDVVGSAASIVRATRNAVKRHYQRMSRDASGHEHKGKGRDGGQFTGPGRGGSGGGIATKNGHTVDLKAKVTARAASGKPQGRAKSSATRKTGRVPEQPLSEKSARAKASHHLIDRHVQRYAEENNEPRFAKAMGGVSFPDGEAVDVAIAGPSGAVGHGIELKTMVDNKANKITMKHSAMERKAAWERKNKAPVHTVVLDDSAVFNANGDGKHDESKRRIFYRRGYGSFRVGTMYQVRDLRELKMLLAMPDKQLPPAAQRPTGQKLGKLAA